MPKVTKEQIEQWKKDNFAVFMIGVDDLVGYIKFPDWQTWKFASRAIASNQDNSFVEAILKNCWLGGDEELTTDEDNFLNLKAQILEIVEFADFDKKKEGKNYLVKLTGEGESHTFKLAPVTRAIINRAERSASGDTLLTNEKILKKLILEGSDNPVYKGKQTFWYATLVMVVQDLYEKKSVTIKKL